MIAAPRHHDERLVDLDFGFVGGGGSSTTFCASACCGTDETFAMGATQFSANN